MLLLAATLERGSSSNGPLLHPVLDELEPRRVDMAFGLRERDRQLEHVQVSVHRLRSASRRLDKSGRRVLQRIIAVAPGGDRGSCATSAGPGGVDRLLGLVALAARRVLLVQVWQILQVTIRGASVGHASIIIHQWRCAFAEPQARRDNALIAL